MPQCPKHPENAGSQQWPIFLLQTWYSKSRPTRLFQQLSEDDNDPYEGQIRGENRWPLRNESVPWSSSQKDSLAQQENKRRSEEDQEIPLNAYPPEHIPTEQLAHPCLPTCDRGHDEGRQGWTS